MPYQSTCPCACTQARTEWLAALGQTHAYLGNFTRKQDRLAMSAYIVSGDLGGAAEVGSAVMHAVPAREYGERAMNENAL